MINYFNYMIKPNLGGGIKVETRLVVPCKLYNGNVVGLMATWQGKERRQNSLSEISRGL